MKSYLSLAFAGTVLALGPIEAANDRSFQAVDKIRVTYAEVTTPLFSPNDDGASDEATIQLYIDVSGSDGVSGQGRPQLFVEGEISFQGATSAVLPFSQPIGPGQTSMSIELVWDGFNGSEPLPDGDYQVSYTARKVQVTPSGKRNIKDQTWGPIGFTRVDTTPPQVQILAPTDGFLTRFLPVHASVYAADANDIASVTIGGVAMADEGDTFEADLSLSEGPHTLVATAVDAAGNRSDSAPVSIVVDITPPQIAILCPQSGALTTAGFTSMVGDIRELYGVSSVSVNGTRAILSGNTFYIDRLPLTVGSNSFIAEASDLAGNRSRSSVVMVVRNASGGAALISTWAGDGTTNYDGDGQPAIEASLRTPTGLALHPDGPLLLSDSIHRRFRRVGTDGLISTFAGDGNTGTGGDGGPAVLAQFVTSQDVEFGPAGMIYVLDGSGRKVRRIDADGRISTFAGSGLAGESGDNGPALSASFALPQGIAFDASGNLYIADPVAESVRVVSSDGMIRHFAGGTVVGEGIPAFNARLRNPEDISVTPNGEILIADRGEHRIRRVDRNGIIRTVAGTGVAGYNGDGQLATSAQLRQPYHAVMDNQGRILIADMSNHRIRRVNVDGTIETVAGTGVSGFSGDGGRATAAKLNGPRRLLSDGLGGYFISDTANNRVRRVTSSDANPDDVLQCLP